MSLDDINLDRMFYKLPLIGNIIKDLYTYFKRHTAYTDFIHVFLGIGIALIVVGDNWLTTGSIFLTLGVMGHIYAYNRGKNINKFRGT